MDPAIDSVAAKIRTAFLAQKTIVFGKKAKVGGRYDKWSFWNQAAEKCLQLSADPDRFVECIFRNCPDPKTLFPNMLYGKLASRCWAQGEAAPIEDILIMEVKTNVETLKRLTGSSEIASYYHHVTDRFFPMLPYMRLLLFPMDPDLIRKFGMEAWEFLSTRPEHVKVLDKLGFRYNDFNEYMTTHGIRH